MQALHVDAILAKMLGTPAAAADLRKSLGVVWRWAKKHRLVKENVILEVDTIKQRRGGYYTWKDSEIQTFCAYHGEGSRAWLMLVLAFWTAGRRSELHKMGWANVEGDWLYFDRQKNDDEHRIPISGALADALTTVPRDQAYFVCRGNGEPYTVESYANLFREYRIQAGLERGSLHGLRKAFATRLAEAGGTDAEGMAILGHTSAQTFEKYRRAAQRKLMAKSGMNRLEIGALTALGSPHRGDNALEKGEEK